MSKQIVMREGALDRTLYWLRRAGTTGFLFFLAKGLAWLLIPAVMAATTISGGDSVNGQAQPVQQGGPAAVLVKSGHQRVGENLDQAAIADGERGVQPFERLVDVAAKGVNLCKLVAHVFREAVADFLHGGIAFDDLIKPPVRHGAALEAPGRVLFAFEEPQRIREITSEQRWQAAV